MNKQRIFLLGGGGHCKSCIYILDRLNAYEIIGIIDFVDKIGEKVGPYEVIGNEDVLADLMKEGDLALLTVGQIKNANIRRKLAKKLDYLDVHSSPIIADTSIVADDAEIGDGTIIMHRALVNSGTKIGEHCIINTSSIVEHDAEMGDFCHVSTMAILNGGVVLGNDVFVGSNSTIIHGVHVADNTIIAAGSTVVSDITQSGTYVGTPARLIESKKAS